jgi:hypothetical protein
VRGALAGDAAMSDDFLGPAWLAMMIADANMQIMLGLSNANALRDRAKAEFERNRRRSEDQRREYEYLIAIEELIR